MKPFKAIALSIFTILFVMLTLKLFPDKLKDDETIIFPSTYGWLTKENINISVHGWIFEMEENSILRNSFVELLKDHLENSGDDEKKNLEDRIRYFLTDNKRGKDITITIMREEHSIPKSSSNGHSLSVIKIKNEIKNYTTKDRQSFSTVPGANGSKTFTGTFQIIGERGYSIISDIDDTIKESNVLDKKELVKNTFFRKFKHVKGMPELYKKFEKTGAVFHYVSGSPWQLYPAIHNFINDEQFPEGSVELKFFRIKDKSFINFVIADQLTYKINSIKTIIDRFPQRKFILIGDSGEKDPEVYTELASRYKERIEYIFIRDVGLIEESSTRRKDIINKAGNVKVVIFKEAGELEKFIPKL